MIAKLTGALDSSSADGLVLDVAGVGYLVFVSGRMLSRLPARGEVVSLLINTHVREDHIHLYGFSETAEQDSFRLLLSVQGVGAKVALAILSVLGPDEITQAIAARDREQPRRKQHRRDRLDDVHLSQGKHPVPRERCPEMCRRAAQGDHPPSSHPGGDQAASGDHGLHPGLVSHVPNSDQQS